MSHDDATARTALRARRRVLVVGGVLVVAAIVVALVATGLGGGEDDGEPGAASSSGPATATAPSTAGTGGSATPTPSPGDLPAAGPDTPEAPPVGLDASPAVVEGVTVRVKSVTAADGEASLPGEVTGPAVRAELEIANESGSPVDLSSTIVNLAYGAGRIPANTFATGTSPFGGTVDTGSSATGVYVFAVPADDQGALRLTLDYAVDVPVVVFEGSAS